MASDDEIEAVEARLDALLEAEGIDPETLEYRGELALAVEGFAAPPHAPYTGFDLAWRRVLH